MPRWIVLYRGKPINNLGGYTTKKGALNSYHNFETLNKACEFARSLGCPPGILHLNAVQQWFEDNLSVIEVSEISYMTDKGKITIDLDGPGML